MKKFYTFFIMKWAHIAKYIYLVLGGIICSELGVFTFQTLRLGKEAVGGTFSVILNKSCFDLFFCLFLVLSFALVCYTYYAMGEDSPSRITLFRMNITQKMHLTTGWLLAVICILMLYAVQLLIIFLAYIIFTVLEGNSWTYAFTTSGALYTGLYRNEFLFRLYPVANPLRWLGSVTSLTAVFTILPSVIFINRSDEFSLRKKILLGICSIGMIFLLLWADSKETRKIFCIILSIAWAIRFYRISSRKGVMGR